MSDTTIWFKARKKNLLECSKEMRNHIDLATPEGKSRFKKYLNLKPKGRKNR